MRAPHQLLAEVLDPSLDLQVTADLRHELLPRRRIEAALDAALLRQHRRSERADGRPGDRVRAHTHLRRRAPHQRRVEPRLGGDRLELRQRQAAPRLRIRDPPQDLADLFLAVAVFLVARHARDFTSPDAGAPSLAAPPEPHHR